MSVFSNDTDEEVYDSLFGTKTAPATYTYTDSNGDIKQVPMTVTINRDGDGNIQNITVKLG